MTDEKPTMKLYGRPGAEYLELTIAGAYERYIEPYYSPRHSEPLEIEEWSVADNIDYIPSAERILDDIIEWTANEAVVEEWYEAAAQISATDPEVSEALEKLRRVLADKVKYHMADKKLRSFWITINGGNPYFTVDDDPEREYLYMKTGASKPRGVVSVPE